MASPIRTASCYSSTWEELVLGGGVGKCKQSPDIISKLVKFKARFVINIPICYSPQEMMYRPLPPSSALVIETINLFLRTIDLRPSV